MSHGLMLTNSLKCKNPAKANRQAVASLKSDRVLLSRASLTISPSIVDVTGSFFTIGLAKILCIPSNVAGKYGINMVTAWRVGMYDMNIVKAGGLVCTTIVTYPGGLTKMT